MSYPMCSECRWAHQVCEERISRAFKEKVVVCYCALPYMWGSFSTSGDEYGQTRQHEHAVPPMCITPPPGEEINSVILRGPLALFDKVCTGEQSTYLLCFRYSVWQCQPLTLSDRTMILPNQLKLHGSNARCWIS